MPGKKIEDDGDEDSKFPKTLFITREVDDDSVYFSPHEEVEEFENDGETVAIYELKRITKVSVTKRIVD